jgi:aspartate/methionine/tyrosine aminotransferase
LAQDAELFACELTRRGSVMGALLGAAAPAPPQERTISSYVPHVDERLLDIFARAQNPEDPFELRNLWLGRVECEARGGDDRSKFAIGWRRSQVRRALDSHAVLSSRATTRFVKELFNSFFRDDLYGRFRTQAKVILSSGSVDEVAFGLPEPLKACVRFALARDWYGYSDSRGREVCREAIAAYENARIGAEPYSAANVAITMGGTFGVHAIADFLLAGRSQREPALCAIPNYPPCVEAVARHTPVTLVPLPCSNGVVTLAPLIEALKPETPLVLLQTVSNPTGGAIPEQELERLVSAASPRTMILLDECHECVGTFPIRTLLRASPNVIRVSSLSKSWSAPGLKAGWFLGDKAFVGDYYEYASTAYGGPPSFFFTLLEVLARMERWLVTGIEEVGEHELHEFEPHYGLTSDRLARAYSIYRGDRQDRDQALGGLRSAAVTQLATAGLNVMIPHYSINAMVSFPGWEDSYVCFRDILRETGVSVLPGILTFGFAGPVTRVTTARGSTELQEGMRRLAGRSRLL